MNNENKSHLDYPLSNVEWVMNKADDTLCSYLANWLDIRVSDERMNFIRFGGILDYYVRNEYGYMYKSCHGVNNIMSSRHRLDPWNRSFLVFPDNSRNRVCIVGYHQYEVYYSDSVYKTEYADEFKGDRVNIRYNVVLLTTTVHGRMVYCVDILAGAYKNI
jgi:hypothetical protein